MDRPRAILLLGPTGSGKTPLGEALRRSGLWGRRCHHFDFGEVLRRAASGEAGGSLNASEIDCVMRVLASGALLEDGDFGIARKLLIEFVGSCGAGDGDILVLNGLPRHAAQADAVDALVEVRAVAVLSCGPDVIMQRIRTDAGRDRAERQDDGERAVRRRLRLFSERTAPLVERYRSLGVTVRDFEVGPATTPDGIVEALEREGGS